MSEKLKDTVLMIVGILSLCLGLTHCSCNVDYVKSHAEARMLEMGYSSPIYEGFQWGIFGGSVWYQAKRADSPGILYNFYLVKYGKELQLCDISVISGNQIQVNSK